MEFRRIESILEAILFAAGDEVSNDTLCKILEVDKKALLNIMDGMMLKLNNEKRGIQIIQVEDAYQMCTRHEYYEYASQLYETKHKNGLSQAALETLSIIAYKQPITRPSIEQIRGIGCDTSVARLMEKNLIKEVGRMDAPGKPILYGTTEDFLRSFGIKSIKELPVLETNLDEVVHID